MDSKPRGKEYAMTCPHCRHEGSVSFENQELTMNDDKSILHLYNGFFCYDCGELWGQEIDIELGNAIKNEVKL